MKLFSLVGAIFSAPALASDLRDYCPDRPGLGTPACIIDEGHVSVELGVLQWSRRDDGTLRADTMIGGDLLVRLGVANSTEVQLGFTAFGRERVRDASGGVASVSQPGDVTLALRRNLRNPDGAGAALALMPWVTLPVGQPPIGAGALEAGLTIPASLELSDRLSLELVPQIAAAVNESGKGRHLAYGGVIGLTGQLTERLAATIEYLVERDHDPAGHDTSHIASLSFGWMTGADVQFDIGGDLELGIPGRGFTLYGGISRRF